MTHVLFDKHRRSGVDSNVLIHLLEGSGALADKSAGVLDAIAAGDGSGVLASLALAEICSGPAQMGDLAMVERYADELTSLENVQVVPLDADVALDAAVIRGSTSMSLADAIHLACARHAGATVFVTNDRRVTPINRLEVAYLDDL